MAHFLHRPDHHLDPQFLHDKRLFLEREHAALRVMERHRDHLVADIERARDLAHRAHIPLDQPTERAVAKLLAVIGVGNHFRRDDAAGLEVARRLALTQPAGVRILEQEGEPGSLLEAWSAAEEALVIDGVFSDAPPGTLHRFDALEGPLPAELFKSSTHALGVAEAVELARELDRLPRRLIVYGIEGESFEQGEGLTPVVNEAVERLTTELHRELDAPG